MIEGPDSGFPLLLVVGVAERSLGEAIFHAAVSGEYGFADVVSAGIGQEEFKLDVNNRRQISEVLNVVKPDIIACTVGVNEPTRIMESHMPLKMHDAFRVNVLGPLELLQSFITSPVRDGRETSVKKFVAVSSNSARIPRTGSVAYCATKAALSMALRCAARELAREQTDIHVWGYEPGLLAGTPMTKATAAALGNGDPYDGGGYATPPLHRMEGVPSEGIPVHELAERIVNDLAGYSSANNGVMYPFDADEL